MAVRVAVVGAGPLGVMAVKNLKEDGFDVTAFDRRPQIGGLWQGCHDTYVSVTASTVFNSSRFTSAISDFPYLPHHDDYPTAAQLIEYVNAYVDHFGIRQHIHLNTEVVSLRRIDQKWEIKTAPHGSPPQVDYFDKVLVSTGSFLTPRYPTIQGIEHFQGKKVHSVDYSDPAVFQGENVLVVGLHATAQDVTKELSKHASKVFISHRSGVVMISRFTEDGRTYDQAMTASFFLKIFLFALRNFPSLWTRLADSILVKMSKKAFPTQRKDWNLLPAPSMAVKTPVVADEIFPLMESGFATPVSEIEHVSGSKQVTLKDGRVLNEIDSIIYCTGYDFDVPRFVPQEFHPYPVKGKEPYLYRNIFPLHPDPDVRNSLAFLGQAAFPLPGFVQFEMYGLAVSQVWQGKSELPPLMAMEQWHNDNITWRNKLCKQHKVEGFYSVFTRAEDMTPWLNEIAGTGLFEYTSWFSRKAWSFWWQDPKFYNLVTSGLFSPSIWRLFDMGKRKAWKGAKEQIIQDNEFAAIRAKERVGKMRKEKEEKEAKKEK